VEAVLAWTVREGATNVIRHSRASRCTIRVTAGLASATVEVIDDGDGRADEADSTTDARRTAHSAGHGLAGLRERAEAMHGRTEAGRLPDGGFRLAVSVPTSSPADPRIPSSSPSAQPMPAQQRAATLGPSSVPERGRGTPEGDKDLPGSPASNPVTPASG
jgi:two-component system sensor histidine kinase DesK